MVAGHVAGAGEAGHHHGTITATVHDHGTAEEPVSRDTQRGIGLLTATVVYGAALGGLFAIVFDLVYGRESVHGTRGPPRSFLRSLPS